MNEPKNKNPAGREIREVKVTDKQKRDIKNYLMPVFAKGYSYGGASEDKVAWKGFEGVSGSAREDIHDNLATLRNNSRILTMTAPVAKAIIRTFKTNVIGRGLKLQSRVDREVLGLTPEQAEELEDQIEREFALWAEDRFHCDVNGVDDFNGLQQLAFGAALESGDCFVLIKSHHPSKLRPYSLRLQIVEADRCRTPDSFPGWSTTAVKGNLIYYDGVGINKTTGEIDEFCFSDRHPYESLVELNLKETFYRVKARGARTGMPNVLQVMERDRPEQYRGVPILAEVAEQVLQINRYANAEVMAALLQNYIAAWITKKAADEDNFELAQLGEDAIRQTLDEMSWSPASMIYLEEGESINFNDATHPGTNYPAFIEANMMMIGAGVGMPYEIVSKRHDSSYSASRAAHLDFSKEVEMRREWFTEDFCRPVFEWFMTEAVAKGRIQAPGFNDDPIRRKAYLRSDWIGPSQGMLSPKEEVEACITAITEGLMTHEQASMMLNGLDWYSNVSALKRERELLNDLPVDPNRVQTVKYDGKEGGEQESDEAILERESSQEPDPENRDPGGNTPGPQ